MHTGGALLGAPTQRSATVLYTRESKHQSKHQSKHATWGQRNCETRFLRSHGGNGDVPRDCRKMESSLPQSRAEDGELLAAKPCVSRAPPTRAVAPGLVPRLPALEEEQAHRRGRQTGTRRREMLRAEKKRR